MTASKRGTWATIRRIAASDRISGLIMLGFALAGLLLANLPFTAHTFEELENFRIAIPHTNIDMGLGHWVQDGLLTVFFLTVGLELKQELTTGSLSNPKAAAVPMLCAVGGMMAPPVLFLLTLFLFSGVGSNPLVIASGTSFTFGEMSHGWAVPTATDIAIILIAVFFSSVNAWYWFVGIAVCAVVWYFLVRMRKVPWFAVAIVGILAWVMMFEAGVHPTLAGVLVGLLTPAHECYGEKTPRAERYADKLQPFSALLALPIFALFATGVHFESLTLALFVSPVVVAVMVALVIGKPLGIMITAWLSTHVAGLKMAKGLRVRDMFPAACACGIGFTVSFLISSLAYKDAELSAEARFGVLVGSMVAAVIAGILLSRQSKKFELTAAASSKHKHHTADEDAAGEVESVLEDGTVVVSQMINTHPKVK